MIDLLGSDWGAYKELMGDAHLTFSQKAVTWKKRKDIVNIFGEDQPLKNSDFLEIPLLVLCNYNYMRSWPITNNTESGEIDGQSLQVLINKEYLRGLGYINLSNYWEYKPDFDRLVIDGLQYKFFGDTAAAQMQDDDVHITFIAKRDITQTGSSR